MTTVCLPNWNGILTLAKTSGLLLERTEVILGPDELVFSELDIISRSSDG